MGAPLGGATPEGEAMSLTFEPICTPSQIEELAHLADEIWSGYWPALIGAGQTAYMVEQFQSAPAIRHDLTEHGYRYWMLHAEDGRVVGYTGAAAERLGTSPNPAEDRAMRRSAVVDGRWPRRLFVSKIYLRPEERGCHFASEVLDFYERLCRAERLSALYLTVNRGNELGVRAYLGRGLEVVEEVDTPIGDDFFMNDYIMAKEVSPDEHATRPAAVFLDIDGTLGWRVPDAFGWLSREESRLCPPPTARVAASIRALHEAGNLGFLCTGRSECAIHPELLALPFAGMVTMAGSYVRVGDEVVRDVALPRDLLENLVTYLFDQHVGVMLEGTEHCVALLGGHRGHSAWESANNTSELLALAPELHFGKFVISNEHLAPLLAQPWARGRLAASDLKSGMSEVTTAENTKRAGVLSVLDHLGDRVGTTYGFGDSENDMTLLSQVDVGVAMGNGTPELKALASVVVAPVEEDGVASGLAGLGLLG